MLCTYPAICAQSLRARQRELLAEPVAIPRVGRHGDLAVAGRSRDEGDPEPERLARLDLPERRSGHVGELNRSVVRATAAVPVDDLHARDTRPREAADVPAGGGPWFVAQEAERLGEDALGVAAAVGPRRRKVRA